MASPFRPFSALLPPKNNRLPQTRLQTRTICYNGAVEMKR